jgi:DnaK suppressor protein
MKGFGDRRLRPLIRYLEQRERELRRMIEEERKSIESEVYEEFAEHSGDEADRAFARIQATVEGGVIAHHLGELQDLASARDRIENGTFGICTDCGEWIDYQRLKANPTAKRCAECQSRRERLMRLQH